MKVITEIDHAHLDIYVFITLLVLHILYIWWSWTIFGLISPVVCGGGGGGGGGGRASFTLVVFVYT